MTAANRRSGVNREQIRELFSPRAIALIGATNKSAWSLYTLGNLRLHGFRGEVYLVNPRGGLVHDIRAYTTVAELPGDVDLAFVMVPASAVLEVLAQVADAGIRSVVMLTSGFGETGAAGRELERQAVGLARSRGLTVLGPNGNGFINVAANVTPYGLPIPPPLLKGPVGVVLQSGALASAVLSLAQARNVGVSLLVSMGNESMVSMTDVMHYLVHDDATRVIALFVESIRDPDDFLAVADEALAAGKPVVALKVGRSRTGARVAATHTGSIVGDDAVVDAVFRQHGVIRVKSLEDLIVTAGLLAETGALPGGRFGFVTASGGMCEIVADRAEEEGIAIPEFAPETVLRLREVVPEFATSQNPVDVTGYLLVDGDLLAKAVRAVQDDPGLDALVLATELPRDEPLDRTLVLERCRQTAELVRQAPKPLIVMGNTLTDITPFGRRVADETGYPGVLGGIEHGMTALGHAVRWSESYRAGRRRPRPTADVGVPLADPEDGPAVFSEYRAAALLGQHGVPVVPRERVDDADAAVTAAGRFGYPVVVKLAADEVGHKSDVGGVRLDITDAAALRSAVTEVLAAGRRAGAAHPAVLVQPQRRGGVELLVGVVSDPAWGQVLAVGLGGVWADILGDTALRVLPVDREQIRGALMQLRGAALLTGARGSAAADLEAVVDVVAAIADLARELGGRLASLEVNPLLVRGAQVEALDALISWRSP